MLLVSIALAAAATSFGILIATLARTQKQVDGVATLLILLMSALGGSWFPLFMMPDWMQTLGHFTLNAWAMDGYMDLFWRDLPVAEVLPEVSMLFAIAIVMSTIAVLLFRRVHEAKS